MKTLCYYNYGSNDRNYIILRNVAYVQEIEGKPRVCMNNCDIIDLECSFDYFLKTTGFNKNSVSIKGTEL